MDKLEKLLQYYIKEELYEKAMEIQELIAQQSSTKPTEECEVK
ncbi:hypothetical protein [Candidatus Uabimicrobium amorphum]|uniref:Uncharacterized protein n=1 Tax=Uabimicrobium amorphum TaxID=2596890 RepID=A0A5S9F2V6_UABAM|nr:hypothetical protein [Candidatus Uabimicrobium amorphum]BBM82869.1 hypothetical protein UABAM_01212 [Candidatus Uabimicrobium amorphum]